MLFALYSDSKVLKQRDLIVIAKAARRNAAACAEAWGKAPPAVEVFDRVNAIPSKAGIHPILFTESDESPGALAVHFPDPLWYAAARVFIGRGSGVLEGSHSIAEACTHEVLEAFIDPLCNLWSDCHASLLQASAVALEVCDPVQTHYTETAWTMHGPVPVPVANFVTPAWFDPNMLDDRRCRAFLAGGGKFDHLGQLKRPFELHPEGYAIVRDDKGVVSDRWGGSLGALKLPEHRRLSKAHEASRTRRRGCVLSE